MVKKGFHIHIYAFVYTAFLIMSMRIPNWKQKILLANEGIISLRAKFLPYIQTFKKQITYPNVTKLYRIFDKSSYFRKIHLKKVSQK